MLYTVLCLAAMNKGSKGLRHYFTQPQTLFLPNMFKALESFPGYELLLGDAAVAVNVEELKDGARSARHVILHLDGRHGVQRAHRLHHLREVDLPAAVLVVQFERL